MATELLTVREAAALLRVAEITVRHWLTARRLPSYRVGGRRLLARRDVEALIEAGRIPADPRVALAAFPAPEPLKVTRKVP